MTAHRLSPVLTLPRRPAGGRLARLLAALDGWAQRRRLARLDARGLRDIGLSHAEAQREAKRPVWNVPGYWRR